jgi:hypothetical protein
VVRRGYQHEISAFDERPAEKILALVLAELDKPS